jgi:hypothetical protein
LKLHRLLLKKGPQGPAGFEIVAPTISPTKADDVPLSEGIDAPKLKTDYEHPMDKARLPTRVENVSPVKMALR